MNKPLDYANHTTAHKSDITLKENKSSCIFVNPDKMELFKVKVDNGLINDSTVAKCDYIVYWHESTPNSQVFYVELKGSDIKKAFSQIMDTFNLTQNKFKSFINKQAVVVCSRYPKDDSTIRRMRIDLKKMGLLLTVQSRKHEIVIN